ncbi:MAG: signal recognition particle protein [Candidatus Marinimicrobia bacterium]|nr:signal recognition particle protein [Candidatus Neomarinimicrobiota bacterium]
MFEQLQDRFNLIFRQLRGLGKITEKNITDTGREIRRALLEADVNYKVARDFVNSVIENAKGSPVLKSVTPGQQFIKIIHSELTDLLGKQTEKIQFVSKPPTIILLAGLQGSGKTTTAAKLAYYLRTQGKKMLMVAADIYRPAAVEQLVKLGEQIDIPVWVEEYNDPVKICLNGIDEAKSTNCDAVILDTAGRLHVDSEMMEEIVQISEMTKPQEILFVVDGMTGQDAVNSATVFSSALDITGIILTKMDGDARGGAAVSLTAITKKPIKFIGTSEKIGGLELFHPERMASRILGMGDIVTLVEKAESLLDKEQSLRITEKLRKQEFTLEDFQDQLKQMRKLGSMEEVLSLIPGMRRITKGLVMDDNQLIWTEAIINSMTHHERQNPGIINGSRRKRIAMGSGRSVQEVNSLLKQYNQLKMMMKNVSKINKNNRMMNRYFRMIN